MVLEKDLGKEEDFLGCLEAMLIYVEPDMSLKNRHRDLAML